MFEYKLLDSYPGSEAKDGIEIHSSKRTYIRTLAGDIFGCERDLCLSQNFTLHRNSISHAYDDDM